MAAKPEEKAEDNGKPAKTAGTPVIRKLVVAEEDPRDRLMNRQVPAWVISGLIHVLLIGTFILFDQLTKKESKANTKLEPPTTTKIDEKVVPEPDLTNPDLGLDSDVVAAVEVSKEAEFNVEATVVEGEPAGLPNHDKDFASQTATLGSFSESLKAAGQLNSGTEGNVTIGLPGGGGSLAMPGLQGRTGATKERLLNDRGGNGETEAAVARALAWLARQQNVGTGFWEFDGNAKSHRVAATGLCILPFLAAGETHKTGKKYKETVGKGLKYLQCVMKPDGELHSNMYAHGIATVALCEAAGMTRDSPLKEAARKAVDYIVRAQAGNGSWGYTKNTEGDTSIVGWQIQALKSARLAEIPVPQKAFDQAASFLESVASESGSLYGYRTKGAGHRLTAVGLLCRQYMGWTPRNGALARGVEWMWTKFPPSPKDFDMYYIYYATQVVHFFDGPAWHRDWNPKMQALLLPLQITEKTNNANKADIGSWPKDNGNGHIGDQCGKLGTTALACLTLEVYYRHLPLYKRDDGGVANLEK